MKISADMEKNRLPVPPSPAGAQYGAFRFDYNNRSFFAIADDGETTGWEHVSVSTHNRCPNWEEMCFVKDNFFGLDDTVIQFHPKKSDYVNTHNYCLHLWKQRNVDHELPPRILI